LLEHNAKLAAQLVDIRLRIVDADTVYEDLAAFESVRAR